MSGFQITKEPRLIRSTHGNILDQSEAIFLRRNTGQLIATFPIVGTSRKAYEHTAKRIAESRGIANRTHIERA